MLNLTHEELLVKIKDYYFKGYYSIDDLTALVSAGIITVEEATEIKEYNPALTNEFDKLREQKLREVSLACSNAIYAGINVETSVGLEHFSLSINDQKNLLTLHSLVMAGATEVLYHADNALCRKFSADEFSKVALAAQDFITYHTTLCNHYNVWIKRCIDINELAAIAYGVELPEDLKASMEALLNA